MSFFLWLYSRGAPAASGPRSAVGDITYGPHSLSTCARPRPPRGASRPFLPRVGARGRKDETRERTRKRSARRPTAYGAHLRPSVRVLQTQVGARSQHGRAYSGLRSEKERGCATQRSGTERRGCVLRVCTVSPVLSRRGEPVRACGARRSADARRSAAGPRGEPLPSAASLSRTSLQFSLLLDI